MNMRIDSRIIGIILSALLVAGGFTPEVRAECVPGKKAMPPKKVTLDDKSRALGRYKAGNELLKKNDCEGALALFLQSRGLWPNRSNTKNAAICLHELGRFPEALALYEELLDRFGTDLDDEERALVVTTVAELQKKVLIVDVTEAKGTFSIDDEACGALPRKDPVYLMPGSHILRVLRPFEPESLAEFSGGGGAHISVKIPEPPTLAPPPPEPGRWFVQASIGPAIAWSGIGSLPVGQLEQSTGLVTQAYGGYWLSNGTIIGLTTGILCFDSYNAAFNVEKNFSAVDFLYDGTSKNPLYAPFVGVTAGWGTFVANRMDIWFRGALGLMSTQSRNDVDVSLVPVLDIGGRQDTKIPINIAGRQVIRSVPGYASLEIGGAMRVWRMHVGFTMGGLFLVDNGPLLPDVYLMPRGRDSDVFDGFCSRDTTMLVDRNDGDCAPTVHLLGQRAYRPSFILLPQVVIGF